MFCVYPPKHGMLGSGLNDEVLFGAGRTRRRVLFTGAFRWRVVPQRQHPATISASRNQGSVGAGREPLLAQPVQQCKSVEGGFWDAAGGDQAETAVKRGLRDAAFLKYVRKAPITHG